MDVAVIGVVADVIGELLIMLIGVLGTWLTLKLSKRAELSAINAAQQELINMAQITVGELKQTVVDKLKADKEDGKLSQEEIDSLGEMLIDMTLEKMSLSAYNLLVAAGIDTVALIRGVGEDWVNALKERV